MAYITTEADIFRPIGHHADGSSIQKHSAGSHYPFVVGHVEYDHTGDRGCAFVLNPSGSEAAVCPFELGNRQAAIEWAFGKADRLAAELRAEQAIDRADRIARLARKVSA